MMSDALDLSFKGLHDLDAALFGVNPTEVISLNVRGNKLSSMTAGLRRFVHLRRLDLSCNELLHLPAWIKELRNLEELVLDENRLRALPDELFSLSSLRVLSVASNELSGISKGIVRLARLEVLDLWGNQIEVLPDIPTLRQLKVLNVGGNLLTRLPGGLVHCRNLRALSAHCNRLLELDPQIGEIGSLERLAVSNNRLTSLPASLGRASNLAYISALENPLATPPLSTVAAGAEAIRGYLRSSDSPGDISTSHEARLFVLGDADVGKTALIERLVHDIFSTERRSTDGLAISAWTLQSAEMPAPLSINVWDFGGQEIFHSTHRYFLTSNAVYVVVVDPTTSDVLARLEYWTQVALSTDRTANIVIVASKLDQGRVDLDLRTLKDHFPTIAGFYQVSCMTPSMRGSELSALRDELAACCWRRSSVQWPSSWLAVRDDLVNLRSPYLTMTDYASKCAAHNIDKEAASALAALLHQLGTVLHFSGNEWLGNFIIIDPEWATRPVYTLLSSSQERAVDGRLPAASLQSLLRELTPDDLMGQQIIRELMLKFGLVYHHRNNDEYVIPELLPDYAPANLPVQESPWISFFYEYRFMHPGLVPELLTKLRDHIFMSSDGVAAQWRHGAAVTIDSAVAVVREDRVQRRLMVTVWSNGLVKLRDHVQATIEAINRWHNASSLLRYHCRCTRDCSNAFSVAVLKNEVGTVPCELTGRSVSVELLLRGTVTVIASPLAPSPLPSATGPIIFAERIHMGDKVTAQGDAFLSKGQMHAVGSGANIVGSNVQSDASSAAVENATLVAELQSLLEASKREGLSPMLVDAIEDASRKARSGDGAAAKSVLSKLGKESYDIAKKVGLPVITAYLKSLLGI